MRGSDRRQSMQAALSASTCLLLHTGQIHLNVRCEVLDGFATMVLRLLLIFYRGI